MSDNALSVLIKTRGSTLYDWLQEIGLFEDVKTMLASGVSITQVRDFVINQIGGPHNLPPSSSADDAQPIQPVTLYQFLAALRRTLTPSDVLEAVEPHFVLQMRDRMSRGLDEIEELESLYMIQLGRVSMFLEQEQRMKFPIKSITADISMMASLLEKRDDLKRKFREEHEAALRSNPEQLQRLSAGAEPINPILKDPIKRRVMLDLLTKLKRVDDKVGLSAVRQRIDEASKSEVVDAKA